ncbi:MAG: glycosyl transferase family 36, partial [Ignavibacteria bacterium]
WEVPGDRGHWNVDWPYVAFHSSSLKPSSHDTDKETFLGMYGRQSLPDAVKEGKLRKRTGNWLDPVASLHAKISLRPNEKKTISFTLGAADSKAQASKYVLKYRRLPQVDRALQKVHERWGELLNTVTVDTPDDAMNIMQNVWLKYQTSIAG